MTKIDVATTIERFDLTVGPLTFQARQAGPGTGRPVILLHGAPQTAACWDAQLRALGAAGHHAVAFTQRGYSPGARFDEVEAYTLDKLVGDVIAVADHLGFDRFDVVGHDFGGGVAWAVAGHHPERVSSVTVASTPHPAAFAASYRDSEASAEDDQHERSGYMRMIKQTPRGELEKMFLANDGQFLRAAFAGLPEESVEDYMAIVGTFEGARASTDWYRAGSNKVAAATPTITVPTLFVWSDDDPALGPAAAHATADHVTGPYRFVVLKGVGHWIPELAAEQLNRELLAHLGECSAA